MTQCSVGRCDGQAKTRGWCQAHYMRWRATGDTGSALVVRKPRGRTCSVAGCDRKHCGRGYCEVHLRRFLMHGDPGSAEIEPRNPGAACSVSGCGKPVEGKGLCNAHYLRARNTGDPLTPYRPHYQWTGDSATYTAVHQRLRKQRGRAAELECSCGAPARQWAYDYAAPNEKRDGATGKPYSTDLSHYQPMCTTCHRRFDVLHQPARACSVDGCDRPHKARGMCNLHYRRSLAEA